MSKYQTFGLVFEEFSGTPHECPPTLARIYLQTHTTSKHTGFSKPIYTLTPVEYDPDTFDAHVDGLIVNLCRLKKEAHRKFERARARGH